MKRLIFVVMIVFLGLVPAMMGCQGEPTDNPILPGGSLLGINLEPGDINLDAGHTVKFIATGIFPGGVAFDLTPYVSWTSSSPSIAFFLDDGTLVASVPGTVQINAHYGTTNSQTISVTVPGAPDPGQGTPDIPVLRSITVTPKSATISEGDEIQYTCTGNFSDNHTEDYTNVVTWRISDPTLGYIMSTGKFVSLKDGGIISVSAKYGTFESNYAVLSIRANP